jgi:hypothetical protein
MSHRLRAVGLEYAHANERASTVGAELSRLRPIGRHSPFCCSDKLATKAPPDDSRDYIQSGAGRDGADEPSRGGRTGSGGGGAANQAPTVGQQLDELYRVELI